MRLGFGGCATGFGACCLFVVVVRLEMVGVHLGMGHVSWIWWLLTGFDGCAPGFGDCLLVVWFFVGRWLDLVLAASTVVRSWCLLSVFVGWCLDLVLAAWIWWLCAWIWCLLPGFVGYTPAIGACCLVLLAV